jgi:mRNA interferase RelE/StbE
LYRAVLTNRARKGLEKTPNHIKKRFVEALDALRQSFAPIKLCDVKKLKGYTDTFRIRIGDWRMIYELQRKEATIVVFEIGPRGRIDY